jgi:MYXO-CTERM domain-containing protein
VLDDAGLVLTTGSSRRTACDRSLDVASLAAFARDGSPRWTAYGDIDEDMLCGRHGDPASTRGVAVARGDDGLVYLLAEVEGRNDLFAGRPDLPGVDANNVVFDVYTDPETAHPQQLAYYARFTPEGRHVIGQYFVLPAAGSVVRPAAIAADLHGNVYLAGAASHSLGAADEVAASEALDRMAGFYQVVEPDLEARRVWQQLDADDMRTDIAALAISGDRVVTLLEAAAVGGPTEGALPSGPGVLQWPGGFGPVAAEKRPDPETQGTFGYESGVSGADPTCYCDTNPPAPAALLALTVFTLAALRRPRRG